MRVSAAGGVPQPVVFEQGKDKGTPGTGWPEFLPDGKHSLYTIVDPALPEMMLAVGNIDAPMVKPLFKTTTRVQYASPGYLLFVRDRTLVAQRFDVKSQSLEGEPVPIGEGLGTDDVGLASFSVSKNGILVYRGGELVGSRLVWMDRTGRETPALNAPADYRDTSLSPDGTRLVYDVVDGSKGDLWMRDLSRGVSSRFTFDPADEVDARWSPDGRRVVYTSKAKGPGDLYVKDGSGTRDAEPLLVDKDEKYVSDWSADGRYILITSRSNNPGGWGISALPLDGEKKPIPIVKTQFDELWATFSPDGKYIAYQSNESGRNEIYVQEFPEARNKWQVSTGGGVEAYWRGDGRELFYRSGSSVMSVSMQIGATLTVGTPAPLLRTQFATTVSRGRYRPTPDGQRFLILMPLAREAEQPAAIVLNWTAALNR
jgi:hypothetical protein